MINKLKYTVVAAVIALTAGGVQAATIVNGSFELGTNPGVFTTLGEGSTSLTGWTISGGGVRGDIDYIGTYWKASDGERSLDLNGNRGGASISQLVTDLVIGKKYRLSFDLSSNTDGGLEVKSTRVGTTAAFSILNSSSEAKIPNIDWRTYSYDFVADNTGTFVKFNSENSGAFGPALDNVSIALAPVPVPAAGFLLMGALAGFGALRRRKKA